MNPAGTHCAAEVYTVRIPPIGLAGTLRIPAGAAALVIFAHGSGSVGRGVDEGHGIAADRDHCNGLVIGQKPMPWTRTWPL